MLKKYLKDQETSGNYIIENFSFPCKYSYLQCELPTNISFKTKKADHKSNKPSRNNKIFKKKSVYQGAYQTLALACGVQSKHSRQQNERTSFQESLRTHHYPRLRVNGHASADTWSRPHSRLLARRTRSNSTPRPTSSHLDSFAIQTIIFNLLQPTYLAPIKRSKKIIFFRNNESGKLRKNIIIYEQRANLWRYNQKTQGQRITLLTSRFDSSSP